MDVRRFWRDFNCIYFSASKPWPLCAVKDGGLASTESERCAGQHELKTLDRCQEFSIVILCERSWVEGKSMNRSNMETGFCAPSVYCEGQREGKGRMRKPLLNATGRETSGWPFVWKLCLCDTGKVMKLVEGHGFMKDQLFLAFRT